MAVDLNKFKIKTEKRLPIVFLVEESNNSSLSADLVMVVLRTCLEKNIHAEFMLLSFGLDWTLRYPTLKDNAPYFARLEEIDLNDIWRITNNIQESKQTFLGSTLDLAKAILDDPETMKPDRYKPVVIVIASRTPAKGWEESLDTLLNDGRSSNAQVYWVNNGNMDTISSTITKEVKKVTELMRRTDEIFSEISKFMPADTSIPQKSTNNPVKNFEKVIYIKNGQKGPTLIAKEIVSSFKLEPLNEVPEEDPVEFDIPGFDGTFGDGADAKGDGVV